jgi:hypothetical protein
LLAGAVFGALLLFVTARYQWARWCKASSHPPRSLTAVSQET